MGEAALFGHHNYCVLWCSCLSFINLYSTKNKDYFGYIRKNDWQFCTKTE